MSETNEELSSVQRFRESHHAVARMLASGMTSSMVRRNTGYSHRRLTLLQGDPTFQELIAVYAKRIGERWEESVDAFVDLAVGNMIAAERQLSDKIAAADDAEEFLPTRELIAIVSDRADRFGYSKHATVRVEHNFAAALDRAIARSGKGDALKQIEGRAVDVSPCAPTLIPHEAPQAQPSPAPTVEPPRLLRRAL